MCWILARAAALAGADAAQRTGDDVHVEAVELDEEAAAQAREKRPRVAVGFAD